MKGELGGATSGPSFAVCLGNSCGVTRSKVARYPLAAAEFACFFRLENQVQDVMEWCAIGLTPFPGDLWEHVPG